jgi:mRNA interferase RelE/StbE
VPYEVRFSRPARKNLRRLRKRDQERVVRMAEGLRQDPRPYGASTVKDTPFLRIRVEDYRVIYEVREEALIVLVVRVAHRREAYRNL